METCSRKYNKRTINIKKIIKSLIRSLKTDLVCLQETKVQLLSRDLVRSLGVGRFLEWEAVSARGVGGGVLVFWDN